MGSCEGDEVFPTHAFNDSAMNRHMLMTVLLRYSAILDASKLRDGLMTLLHTGDWKKLRGRWRLDDANKLSIWVPPAGVGRSALKYKQTSFDMPIAQHKFFSKLATSQTASTVQSSMASIDGMNANLVPSDWPRSLAEFTNTQRDEPILGLHVLSFSDTTLVVLRFSHVLMDGGGLASFISAWSSVVAGVGETMPLVGAREDPLDRYRQSDEYTEPFVLAHAKVDGSALMPHSKDEGAIASDPEWDVSSPETRWRMISLSKAAIASLRQEARESIPIVNGSQAFVSEDDVISAWFFRTIARTVTGTRAMNNYRIYDMRPRLSAFKPDGAYIQNAFGLVWSIGSSASEIVTASLGQLAVALRESLQQQTGSEQQVVAAMGHRDNAISPLYGDPTGLFLMVNSWNKMNIYQRANFSAAVMAGHTDSGAGQPALVDLDFGFGSAAGPTVTWCGKDAHGTWHGVSFLSNIMWPGLEAEIERLGL